MRTSLSTLLLLAALVQPVQGQTCLKAPLPFLPHLVPQRVQGMPAQFTSDPAGGCRAMFRPAAEAEWAARPWAIVAIEENRDPRLGEDAAAIRAAFATPGYTVYDMSGWPVVMRAAPLGDEFVALKGAVRVVVLVKNGDQGEASASLATAFMEAILPKVPCG